MDFEALQNIISKIYLSVIVVILCSLTSNLLGRLEIARMMGRFGIVFIDVALHLYKEFIGQAICAVTFYFFMRFLDGMWCYLELRFFLFVMGHRVFQKLYTFYHFYYIFLIFNLSAV